MCLVVFSLWLINYQARRCICGDCNQAEAVRMIEEAAEAIAARGPKWNHRRFNGTRGEPFTLPPWLPTTKWSPVEISGFLGERCEGERQNQCFSFPESQSWCSTLSQEPPALTASKGEGFLGVFHMQSFGDSKIFERSLWWWGVFLATA